MPQQDCRTPPRGTKEGVFGVPLSPKGATGSTNHIHVTLVDGRKKNSIIQYKLPLEDGSLMTVCKKMFMGTLGLKTDGMITSFINAKKSLPFSVPKTDNQLNWALHSIKRTLPKYSNTSTVTIPKCPIIAWRMPITDGTWNQI